MKKVLLVISSLEQGGGQRFVVDLAKGIDRSLFQVRLLVFYRKSNSVFDRFVEENNLDAVYLDKKVGLDFSFFKQVRRAVKEFKPDVLHTNLDTLLYFLPALPFIRVKLHTMHTLADREAAGLQRLVRKLAFSLFGVKPVAICNTVADSIRSVYHIKRFPVVYNGVDTARFALPKVEHEGFRFISVGTLYPVKNFSFMLDCFAEFCKDFPTAKLILAGDGPERGNLEAQAKTRGVEDRVVFLGCVDDVETRLSKADCYLSSSIFEGFPLSVLEAMSAGLPTIACDVGGISEAVDGTNGFLIPSGDKTAYTDAMKKIASDSSLFRLMSENAKKTADRFDLSNMVKQYEHLYAQDN